MYQHDSATSFRFVLSGTLDAASAAGLEHAWMAASSVLNGKELVVDASALHIADEAGTQLLERMRAAGARLIAPSPPPRAGFWRLLRHKAAE